MHIDRHMLTWLTTHSCTTAGSSHKKAPGLRSKTLHRANLLAIETALDRRVRPAAYHHLTCCSSWQCGQPSLSSWSSVRRRLPGSGSQAPPRELWGVRWRQAAGAGEGTSTSLPSVLLWISRCTYPSPVAAQAAEQAYCVAAARVCMAHLSSWAQMHVAGSLYQQAHSRRPIQQACLSTHQHPAAPPPQP